jgi:hypothetical protein
MRCEVLNPGAQGSGLHDMPNCLGRNSFTPNLAKPVYAPEDSARADAGNVSPFVDRSLRPCGDRNGADVLSLADQVGNNAVFLPILQVLRPQAGQFGPSESASNQQSQDGTIAFAADGLEGRHLQQSS